MFPQAGGAYVYLREAFGPAAAFAYGWTYLIVTPSSWAAIVLIFAEYLGHFVTLSLTGKRIAATAVLLFCTAASYRSLTFATAIQGAATSGKAFALAAIAVVLFALGDGSTGAFAQPASSSSLTFGAFIVALVAVLWPYEGVVAGCAMAGEFFRRIGSVHPRFQTPHVSVAVCGALAILYIWISTFEALAAQFILGVWPLYALTVAGLIWLRLRRPDAERPYRAPLYPFVPVIFLLAATALLVGSIMELPVVSAINFAIIGASYPVYLLWRRASARAIVSARDVSPEHASPKP
jgi:amino acid transporter